MIPDPAWLSLKEVIEALLRGIVIGLVVVLIIYHLYSF